MNCNKARLTYVNTVPECNKMFADPTKNIKDMFLPNDEIACIHWVSQNQFVAQDSTTNIFIAAFTTTWARLKLNQVMDKLGENVLYHDTDSIIYAQDRNNNHPLGNFLGEFTDELDGDTITTFIFGKLFSLFFSTSEFHKCMLFYQKLTFVILGGPKNCAYDSASGKTCCKALGFTLNFKTSEKLNFESIKKMVCKTQQ
nr:uncharacterized protein LOC107437440 [Parasteatoda tepidariorum]